MAGITEREHQEHGVSHHARVPLRLVLDRAPVGEATALLYPIDSTPWSAALFSFPVRPDQEVPRLAAGAAVTVDEPMEKGGRPTVHAGDVDIVPAKGLRVGGGGRIFAERGGVIAHPAIVGWQSGRRYVSSGSLSPIDDWSARLHRETRVGILSVGLLLVYVVVFDLALLFGHQVLFAYWPFGASGAVTSILAWWRATRSRRALREATSYRNRPAVPMAMTLIWTAGHGHGPMAVASLSPCGSAVPLAHLGVVNVPAGFDPEGRVDVEVLGDPMAAPIPRTGDVELWPAEHAQLVLGARRRWRRRTRSSGSS